MKRERDERLSPPAVGGTALLVIFAILCLTVFALLSIGTVQAERRLSNEARDSVIAYYALDARAQEIFARLRAGEKADGVLEKDGIYAYSCADSQNRKLNVEIEKSETGWRVLRWQVESHQPEVDDALPVWNGR